MFCHYVKQKYKYGFALQQLTLINSNANCFKEKKLEETLKRWFGNWHVLGINVKFCFAGQSNFVDLCSAGRFS
uniref:Uncharacterized protein n=1 Tax=Syphacia muris TaxID=451379 RepID=A0A0N5AM59_9BILA